MLIYRRLNYSLDIAEVVDLIQSNLDPTYSEDILLWKHRENIFGESISMVAVENNRIVAVVFYMRYNYTDNSGKVIKTIRPLDVCTDKDQRGKGVFKILLQKCLELIDDYDVLISTPNQKSYPEFIKLGWSTVTEKFFFKIGLVFPPLFVKKIKIKDTVDANISAIHLNIHGYFITGNSDEFIKWRYKDLDYKVKEISINNSTGYIIYRTQKIKNIKCIILCDYFGDTKNINDAIKSVCWYEKLFIVYFLENKITSKINFSFKKKLKRAVIVYKENHAKYNNNLVFSLGDMEARL